MRGLHVGYLKRTCHPVIAKSFVLCYFFNKWCFINKVREEHVQIINTSGEHSAINGKRYIYTQQSHLIPLTVLQQRRPTGRAKPAGPKNRLPSHHRRLPAQDPDRFAHQDAATGLQQAWAAHQIRHGTPTSQWGPALHHGFCCHSAAYSRAQRPPHNTQFYTPAVYNPFPFQRPPAPVADTSARLSPLAAQVQLLQQSLFLSSEHLVSQRTQWELSR